MAGLGAPREEDMGLLSVSKAASLSLRGPPDARVDEQDEAGPKPLILHLSSP